MSAPPPGWPFQRRLVLPEVSLERRRPLEPVRWRRHVWQNPAYVDDVMHPASLIPDARDGSDQNLTRREFNL